MNRSASVLLATLLLAAVCAPARAQALGDLESKTKLNESERAKRDADKVFQWIKFHAERGDASKARADSHKADAKADAKPEPKAEGRAVARPARGNESDELAAREARARALAHQQSRPASAPEPAQAVAARDTAPAPASTTPAPGAQPEPRALALASPSAAPPTVPVAVARQAEPEEEVPLALIKKVDPDYPRQLLASQRTGTVTLRFTVLPDGSVQDPEALKSPHRRLSAAAIDAVKQWRFAPIGKPRQVSVDVGFMVE